MEQLAYPAPFAASAQRFENDADFYFVHSYVFKPADIADTAATTSYAEDFCSLLHRENIFGVQCHPENSQKAGTQLMRTVLSLT